MAILNRSSQVANWATCVLSCFCRPGHFQSSFPIVGSYLVSEQVNIAVNVMQRSVNATANWLFQMALKVANLRGLSPEYLIKKREIIENGLFVWLAERTLEGISIEVFDSSREDAHERFDFYFTYHSSPDPNVREPNIARLEEFCRTLEALPPGMEYRVVVSIGPNASEVPGWYDYEFRPLVGAREERLSDHGFGHISTHLIYRGR